MAAMKTALAVTTALGLALAASTTFTAPANAQQVMKIAHILPAGDPRDLGARKLEEVIEAENETPIT